MARGPGPISRGGLPRRVVLAGVVALAGCGAPFPLDRDAEMAALRAAQPPFTTFEALDYERVAIPSETPFQILRSGPVMAVGTAGKTFAKGFELAPGDTAVEIMLYSYIVQGGRAFFPIVTMLDANKVPMRSTLPSAIRIVPQVTAGPDWRLVLPIRLVGKERIQVRYFVVHTSREIVELGFAGPDEPWQVASTIIFIPVGGGRPSGPPQVLSSPSGALSMTISDLRR